MATDPADPHGAALNRAFGYPYAIPGASYLLMPDGTVRPLSAVDLKGRTPVLASGSNQAPEQLRRKFGGHTDRPVPVVRGAVAGVDMVHSAHVARYGSIPATPMACPGVTATAFITWLDDRQLARMHATEALGLNYDVRPLAGVTVTQPDLAGTGPEAVDAPLAYVSRWGALAVDGRPVPLAAVPATGRTHRALGQRDVLTHARDRLAPGADLSAFVLAAVHDPDERARRTRALAADAVPLAWDG
ncbi:MAG: hypothetical protein KDE22_13020 [Rhodobacterales bacterium]|nr:hypothetical protein [Rhodobacterales bacterium]